MKNEPIFLLKFKKVTKTNNIPYTVYYFFENDQLFFLTVYYYSGRRYKYEYKLTKVFPRDVDGKFDTRVLAGNSFIYKTKYDYVINANYIYSGDNILNSLPRSSYSRFQYAFEQYQLIKQRDSNLDIINEILEIN